MFPAPSPELHAAMLTAALLGAIACARQPPLKDARRPHSTAPTTTRTTPTTPAQPIATVADASAPQHAPPEPSLTATPTAAATPPATAPPPTPPPPTGRAGELRPPSSCAENAPGCACVTRPRDADRACWSHFGGHYSHGGCVRDGDALVGQCCAGAIARGVRCGDCRCSAALRSDGCIADADRERHCAPPYRADITPIDDALAARMRGVTLHEGCPLPRARLAALRFAHFDLGGHRREGLLIVEAAVADKLAATFGRLYRHRFPLVSARPAHEFGGSDDASMAVDNTSSFNCRAITGGKRWSEHAYGRAIDLNPLRNPYVRGDLVAPPAGRAWLDRADVRAGMLVDPGPAVGAFRVIGWGWGGAWRGFKDYQHVSASGR